MDFQLEEMMLLFLLISLSVTGASNSGRNSFYTFNKEFAEFLEKNENTLDGIKLLKTKGGKVVGLTADNTDELQKLIEQYTKLPASPWSMVDVPSTGRLWSCRQCGW